MARVRFRDLVRIMVESVLREVEAQVAPPLASVGTATANPSPEQTGARLSGEVP